MTVLTVSRTNYRGQFDKHFVTYRHLFGIFWHMLQSNFSHVFDGKVDFCKILRIPNQLFETKSR